MDFEHLPDGIIVADDAGMVRFASRRAGALLECKPHELVGSRLADALPFDDLAGNSWVDVNNPYKGFPLRTRISEASWYSPSGAEFLVTASLVRDRPAGKVIQVVLSVRSARVRDQRDRERSDMVATVAHELRSPLTGIKGFAATLLSRWDKFTDDQRRFMLETVDADADRLSRLITELLDAARIDSGRLTLRIGPVQVDDVAERVLRSVFATNENTIKPTIVNDIPVIWADEDRITQALTNLVENAMRHGNGLRELRVSHTDDQVTLEVIDDGPGIPTESRERIFSRFWKSGPGAGSGLGMFIVQGVVTQHGGEILIGDTATGGAHVTVNLPVNSPDWLTDS